MKSFYGVLLLFGRLVRDHASETHGWLGWALTSVRGDQPKREKNQYKGNGLSKL